MNEPKIIRNRAKCLKCGCIIESIDRHDFKQCSCGALAVDGGLEYIRRNFQDENDFLELSEIHGQFRWIEENVIIDFRIPRDWKNLIAELEKKDLAEDYSYFNLAELLDDLAKHAYGAGQISRSQWDKLRVKYLSKF